MALGFYFPTRLVGDPSAYAVSLAEKRGGVASRRSSPESRPLPPGSMSRSRRLFTLDRRVPSNRAGWLSVFLRLRSHLLAVCSHLLAVRRHLLRVLAHLPAHPLRRCEQADPWLRRPRTR